MTDGDKDKIGTYILIGITILIIIAGIIMLILGLTVLSPEPTVGNVSCTDNTNGLINITNTPCYYNSQGLCSLNRYTTDILGGSFLYTTPTNYTVVCNPLCVGYLNTNWECCSDNNPECQQMKISYNNCVNTVKPNQCTGEAEPVAIDNNILYYVGQVISNNGIPTCDCATIGM